ncbi:MAG TPA: 16S rRNA (cytosine(1402)-N(4))-methyltransferase RsmH [Vicinamibacterales bacterium]|nr:16S rRNA (cytosine(1402)-N(4))-methyltransferase RsmH [Vicinamibacterales bacterium]
MRETSRSSESEARHAPVLVAEVVAMIAPVAEGVYVDCTLGLGGHTAALVAAGAGRVIAIDRDAGALALAGERLGEQATKVTRVHADYRDLSRVLAAQGLDRVNGVVADFGVSSWQLDDASRGFSFRAAGPLDMRMDRSRGRTLAEALAAIDEAELADVIWTYGEERHSRRIARAIVRARDRGDLADTAALAAVVRSGAGVRHWQRIDPATRTFQALRIWVNEELAGLEAFLEQAAAALAPGGRLVVIAFHSLEDRIVKQTFRRLAGEPGAAARLLTRKPVSPSEAEIADNARARSAKLRALEKVA